MGSGSNQNAYFIRKNSGISRTKKQGYIPTTGERFSSSAAAQDKKMSNNDNIW